MTTTTDPGGPEPTGPIGSTPAPSPWVPPLTRAGLVFVRPFGAWSGLQERAGWWFPLLVTIVLQAVLMGGTFQRVLMPTMMEQWNSAVENGQMTAQQLERISKFFESPSALALILGQQVIGLGLVVLLAALVVWFGGGFVLGTRFRYRHALETVTWASLVRIPELLLTFALAWQQESLRGVHLGLGALLPAEETATKLHSGLAVFLDAIGPFGIWYLVVSIAGCAALSGAPRRSVAWVLSALYLGTAAVLALVAGAFGPGA